MLYQIFTLILLITFYGSYFAKQTGLKKQGIQTNRLAKGSKPKQTRAIEKGLLFTTYATALIQFTSPFASARMGGLVLPDPVRAAGVLVTFMGVLFFLLAIITMGTNWRAGVDETQKTAIVSGGIYKYSRNPAFTGFDLLYLGTALTFPNVLLAAFALLAIILLHLQILEEEKYLIHEFGRQYSDYQARVPRYFLF